MPYFGGYGCFTNEEPFSDTLLVGIRKQLPIYQPGKINKTIAWYGGDILQAAIPDQQEPENKTLPHPK